MPRDFANSLPPQFFKQTQTGSSLIEVMVSLFVLAIGILGVLSMQAKSMQFNQSAHTYSQTIYLANDLAERIRTNHAFAESYAGKTMVDLPTAPSNDCTAATATCSGEDIAAVDFYDWSENIRALLPSGQGEVGEVITYDDHTYLQISISFDDSRAEENSAEDDTAVRKTYRLMVEI